MTNDKEAGWSKIRISQSVENLCKYGPSVKIGIAPVPFSADRIIMVLAQIDTGAAGTGMSPALTERLNLVPAGSGRIHEAARDPVHAHYFRARLLLPGNVDVETNIVGLPSLAAPHDILIGRDVLGNCRLLVDFTSGITALHFKAGA